MALTLPPVDEHAEIRALIVALATGTRLNLPDAQLAEMTAEHLAACIPAGTEQEEKNQAIRVYARVIAEQNRLLVDAMGRWNQAAGGGDPAGGWLAQLAAAVARGRSDIPAENAPATPADGAQADADRALAVGGGDALDAAVRLISTRRTNPSTFNLAGEVMAVIADLTARHPGQGGRVLAWLVGQLVSLAAHACDQWDKAVDGTPANAMLARAGAHAASSRK